MEIRAMKETDYDYIISKLNEWWGGRNMEDQLPRLFIKYFSDTCFVAEQDEKVVGFVIGFRAQNNPEKAYIHFVGVDPDYRKMKIAQKLYDTFYRTVAEYGCKKIYSVTNIVNRLSLAFHVGSGFTVVDSPLKVDGISYFAKYDGPNDNKFLFEIDNPYVK